MENIERLLSDAHESIMNKLGELQQTNQAELDACREENRQLRLGIHVLVINPKLAPNSKFIPWEDGGHLRTVPNNGFSLVGITYDPSNPSDPFQIRPDLYKYTIYERVTHPREGFDVLGKIIDGVNTLSMGADGYEAGSVKLRFRNKADIDYIQKLTRDTRNAAKYIKNGREVYLYYDPNEPNVNELYAAEENAKTEKIRSMTEKNEKYIQDEVMKEQAIWNARKTEDNPLGRKDPNDRFEASPFGSERKSVYNFTSHRNETNTNSEYENRLRQQLLSRPSQPNTSEFDGKGRTKRKRNKRTKKHKDKLRK